MEAVFHQAFGGKGLEAAADHDNIIVGCSQFLLCLLERLVQLRRVALVAELDL